MFIQPQQITFKKDKFCVEGLSASIFSLNLLRGWSRFVEDFGTWSMSESYVCAIDLRA